ncbi:hypothetical protein REPUB_Repub13aG0138500 [Reevesia pubescens]
MIPATSPQEVQSARKSQSVRNSSRKSTSHSASISSLASNRASTSGYNESKSSSTHFRDEYTTATGLETGGEHSPGEINGMKIAVKQHKYNASLQGEKEFKSEVQVLRKARHENLVMLVGSCSEGNHRLLVYEFVCNGSLDLHLSSKD